jgi:hypothetical protein
MMVQFIQDTRGRFWPIDRIARFEPSPDGEGFQCDTIDDNRFAITDYTFEKHLEDDPLQVIPAVPGYQVWWYNDEPDEAEDIGPGAPVIGWAIGRAGDEPVAITDSDGLMTDPSQRYGVAVRRPNGSFIIPYDRDCRDVDEFHRYIRKQREEKRERAAKIAAAAAKED